MNQYSSQLKGPLVTVLISTYNRPQYLRQALASVVAQTWPYLDIILVRDGGAPVREAIEPFAHDSRLRLIDRDRNYGKAYSLNEALTQARGEYVCYLDDDDMFYPFHVKTLLEAMLAQDRCQAAYSDLYKAHCRVLPGGRRVVLAKNVEISRDFDRMLMLQFNQALHVSLMHRRDLLDKTGLYNERINVMIDWDMTRRLCFFTDFLHVPTVTGEFYAPVGDCDRISVSRRKNVNDYLCNVLTIRGTRPAKPWPCMSDLSVIVLAQQNGHAQLARELWSHSYYPNLIYVPLTPAERAHFNTSIPNVVVVPVEAAASAEARVDAALRRCEGDFTAIVPDGLPIRSAEVSFMERSLYPLMQNPQTRIAYELVEATETSWGAVLRTDALLQARSARPHLLLAESIGAAGIEIRKPVPSEYPFQLDNYLHLARQQCREGDWGQAARIYEFLADRFDNTLWIKTLEANALYHQGRWEQAAVLAEAMNRTHPTAARLMIEARARNKMNDYAAAAALYRRAEAILDGNSTGYSQDCAAAVAENTAAPACKAAGQQESLLWT